MGARHRGYRVPVWVTYYRRKGQRRAGKRYAGLYAGLVILERVIHFIRRQPIVNRAFKRIARHCDCVPTAVISSVWLERPLKLSYNIDRYISKCITRS